MKKKALFVIKNGRYVVPKFGAIDSTKSYTNDQYKELLLNKFFPFIRITEDAVKYLKKNINKAELITLINMATSIKEIDLYLKIHFDKNIENIAEIKKRGFVS